MNRVIDYFHKNYYSDLPREVIEEHLSNPENADKAIEHIAAKHYSDMPPEKIKPLIKTTFPKNPPFNIPNREYSQKDVKNWQPQDYREYLFDMENGFTDNSLYSEYRKKAEEPIQQMFYGSVLDRRRKLEDAYLNQVYPDGTPIRKGEPLYDKKPSYERLTEDKINEFNKQNIHFDYNEEWKKLGTTREDVLKKSMIDIPRKEYIDYLSSPEYIQIAKQTMGDGYSDFINAQKNRVLNQDISFGSLPSGYYGEQSDNKITLKEPIVYPSGQYLYTTSHELSHATDDGMKGIRWGIDLRKGKNQPSDIQILQNKWESFLKDKLLPINGDDSGFKTYLQDPTEIRARVNSIRQQLIKNKVDLNSSDEILDSKINEIMKGDFQLNQLKKVLKPEHIFKALREMAYNNSDKYLQNV